MKQFSEVTDSACPKCGWFPGGGDSAWTREYREPLGERGFYSSPERILLTCVKCGYTEAVHPMDHEGDEK